MADSPVIYGKDNTGRTTRTLVENTREYKEDDFDSSVALVGLARNHAAGVLGQAVHGTGVIGLATEDTTFYPGIITGVYGRSDDPDGLGLVGMSPRGTALLALGDVAADLRGHTRGIGVTGPTALYGDVEVHGDVRFDSSGVSTIPAGRDRLFVTYKGQLNDARILGVLRDYVPGLWVVAVTPIRWFGVFTIFLNDTAPQDVDVAWFVINGRIYPWHLPLGMLGDPDYPG